MILAQLYDINTSIVPYRKHFCILVRKIKTLTYATYLHGLHFSGEKGPVASGHLTCNLINRGFKILITFFGHPRCFLLLFSIFSLAPMCT